MENAPEIVYAGEGFYSYFKANEGLYYKFTTGPTKGVYCFNFKMEVDTEWAKVYPKTQVYIYDAYLNKFHSCVIDDYEKKGSYYFSEMTFSVNTLAPNTTYYLYIENTGSSSWVTDHSYSSSAEADVFYEFVPFQEPQNVQLSYGAKGNPVISWSNINPYNVYNSLRSYDNFMIYRSETPDFENASVYKVAPGVGSYEDLVVNTGNKYYYKVRGEQTYYCPRNEDSTTTIYMDSATVTTVEILRNSTYVIDRMKYIVTDNVTDGTGQVKLLGTTYSKKSSKLKTLKIKNTVTILGRTFRVTEIDEEAFKGYKKIKKVVMGDNIEYIHDRAFYNCKSLQKVQIGKEAYYIGREVFVKCKNLKKITIKSKQIQYMGGSCFGKQADKITIKVPKSCYEDYRTKVIYAMGHRMAKKIRKF